MSVDLRALIRDALDASDSPDPHVVAEDVLSKIKPRDVRACLAELLADEVRMVIHQQRGSAPMPEQSGGNGKRDLGSMVRDPWRHRVWVPDAGWRFVGDLTADECEAVAGHYEQLAAANEAQAKRWRLRAQWMRAAGVDRLRDLPPDMMEAAA